MIASCLNSSSDNSLVAQSNQHKFAFTFVDLFAGIGGFRIPLEALGGRCVAYSEVDRDALSVYRANFPLATKSEYEIDMGDIRFSSQRIIPSDIVVGGLPCQPWSVAGRWGGMQDSRGTLWFEAIRFVAINQPKAFIFENVPNLSSTTHQSSWSTILKELSATGYAIHTDVLNTANFGLPQDRSRLFIIGIRHDIPNRWKFQFPHPHLPRQTLGELLHQELLLQDLKITENHQLTLFANSSISSNYYKGYFLFSDVRHSSYTIHSWDIIPTLEREKKICLTILRNRRKKFHSAKDGKPLPFSLLLRLIPDLEIQELDQLIDKNILKFIPGKGYEFKNSKQSVGINGIYRIVLPTSTIFPTITASDNADFIATKSLSKYSDSSNYKQIFLEEIYYPKNYRRIADQDAKKLQGFPSWFQTHSSKVKAKKQFGNAVSIPVIYHIAKALLDIIF